jgi:NADPH-dependent curcumin reductase CurA
MWGWQDYHISTGNDVQKLNPALAPITTALGILGMPGMTAYFGFLDICQPKPGETAYISGAAGAVGAIVGQIAKIKGLHVVGSAGTDEKVEYLINQCGYNAAFNYKHVPTSEWASEIKTLCPKGIDCYFDNVGGDMTDAVFANLNTFARISICGVISQYNLTKPELGPRSTYATLLVKQARAEGFIVSRFMNQWPQGIQQMATWIKEGKLKYKEDILDGLENTPKAFMRMLKGENLGKQLVRIS